MAVFIDGRKVISAETLVLGADDREARIVLEDGFTVVANIPKTSGSKPGVEAKFEDGVLVLEMDAADPSRGISHRLTADTARSGPVQIALYLSVANLLGPGTRQLSVTMSKAER